jgi:predicted dehydrogenase
MRIALVGCGYVSDFYLSTLANHPELELQGVTDRDLARAARVATSHGVRHYRSLAEVLADDRVQIIVNLTNPRDHYEVSNAALDAGKHVYTEKPLATDWLQAVALVEQAEHLGLQIASAPCTVLGESAQTLIRAVRDGAIGKVRLAYAELDDGMIHRENFRSWISASGNPWPFKDEFEVGCTLEHAGYYVSWLAAMFGPAKSVTSFASCQLPDKGGDVRLDPPDAPDFSVGCIEYASGVVARLTCGIVASHDHSLRLFGDDGVLSVKKCWDFAAPIYIKRRHRWTLRSERYPVVSRLLGLGDRRYPHVRPAKFQYKVPGANRIDFGRGVAELAASIREQRPCRLTSRYSLHLNEIVLTLQDPVGMGSPRTLTTTFKPIEPMTWASPRPTSRVSRESSTGRTAGKSHVVEIGSGN